MKIRVNDVTLNYAERGLPQGAPIVFIHGFPFNHSMWEPQMKALPNHFRAITYDVRGHGESDVGDGQYSIEFFVDDLIALMDHLVIKQAVLCGLSMGGYIALRAVERHPERVSGLILCDTRSEADSDEGKVKRSATVRSVRTHGVATFAEEFVKLVFAPETFEANPLLVASIREMIEANKPLGICGTALALGGRTDTTKALASIKVPTLVIVGEHDTLTPPAAAQAMQSKIRGSELRIIPRAAHLTNLENSAEFNNHLVGFLYRWK